MIKWKLAKCPEPIADKIFSFCTFYPSSCEHTAMGPGRGAEAQASLTSQSSASGPGSGHCSASKHGALEKILIGLNFSFCFVR